jgi:uncharacterized protein (DUF4415 family)
MAKRRARNFLTGLAEDGPQRSQTMPDLKKQTPKQREQFGYMIDVMRRLEWDFHNTIEMTSRVPDEWHEIAAKRPQRKAMKVNLRLEEDVVKFFKSMGEGYGARINDVLKSYMYARLAGVIKGAETTNHYKTRQEDHLGKKPRFGDTAREVNQEWFDAPATTDMNQAVVVETFQRRFAEEGMPPGGTVRVK